MSTYTISKKGQEVKKVFLPDESLPSSQNSGSYTKLNAEDCSSERSSAVFLDKELREEPKKLGNNGLESLSANSCDFPKSQELELDKDYISLHPSSQVRSHQYITLYCTQCGYRYIAPVKCEDWRLCEQCRKAENSRLRSKYLKFIKSVPRTHLRFITVITKNVQELTKKGIQEIRGYWLKLLRWKYYTDRISGGFYSIEAVHKHSSWNIHLHAIVQVKHQSMLPGSSRGRRHTEAETKLSEDWFELTKHTAKIVKILNVTSGAGALNYLLKDLLKSPKLTGLHATDYLQALKTSRLISTFGKWYARVKEYINEHRFLCPHCGNDSWFSQFALREVEQDLNFARAP